jgi:hypothetical protein
MRITKQTIEKFKKRVSIMIDNTQKNLDVWEKQISTGEITAEQRFSAIKNWSDELFYYKYVVYKFELLDSFKQFEKAEKKYCENYHEGFIEMLNETPITEKYYFKESENINSIFYKTANLMFNQIEKSAKNFPKYLMPQMKNKIFPTKGIDYDKVIDNEDDFEECE